MTEYEITSATNERVKRLVRLRERRHRDAEQVFVVEGPRLVERALHSGLEPLEVFTDGTVEGIDMTEAVLVEPSVLDKASYRHTSQGVIAVFRQYDRALPDLTPSDPALIAVTEGIEKPGNLGAMMRTASAAGVDALVTVDATTDVFNPNVIRSSTGALFTLPVVSASLRELRAWLDENSIRLVATSPSAEKTMWDIDLSGPCAVMIGAEDTGLSQQAIDIADVSLAIPMSSSQIDSLNASVALALVAYEAVRQRSR